VKRRGGWKPASETRPLFLFDENRRRETM